MPLRKGLLLFALFATLLSTSSFAMPPAVGLDGDGQPLFPICPTEDIWQQKRQALGLDLYKAACGTEGACDDPATRDGTATAAMTVDVIVHVINDASGNGPNGVGQAEVDAQIAQMNGDYAPHNISFNLLATRYHNDRKLTCISAYSYSGKFLQDIAAMKSKYAETPDQALNIYVSCQDTGGLGILLGIATFPWDPDALTAQGGLWLNAAYTGSGQKTATHEVGHCLGLWHTHHGVSETGGCADACYENVHAPNDPAADLVGDFCKDTAPTPTNYYCSPPGGTDCNGSSWGTTDYDNFMGYGPDSCIDNFSNDQGGRMHCWTRDVLAGWLGGGGCTDPAPDAPSGLAATAVGDSQVDLSWTDNAGNEDGFVIERDGVVVATVGADVTSYSDAGLACETTYAYRVKATNCGGDSAWSNTAGASTGICPAGPVAHVAAISVTASVKGKNVSATGDVTIVDAGGSPVANATVSADWSGSSSASQTAVTDGNGVARFDAPKVRSSSYCFTLTVTNVTGAGLSYDAGANVVSSASGGNACGARIAGLTPTFHGNHPNPFNPSTTFSFELPQGARVQLKLYDAAGREVATLVNGFLGQGYHEVPWQGTDHSGRAVASGIYYARLLTDDLAQTHRIVLLK